MLIELSEKLIININNIDHIFKLHPCVITESNEYGVFLSGNKIIEISKDDYESIMKFDSYRTQSPLYKLGYKASLFRLLDGQLINRSTINYIWCKNQIRTSTGITLYSLSEADNIYEILFNGGHSLDIVHIEYERIKKICARI